MSAITVHPSSTRARHLRRWGIRTILATTAGLATVLPATATGAQAAVSADGWTFATDVFCDRTLRTVSISSAGVSADGAPADTAYRFWVSADNAPWVGPTGWIMASDRNAYYDGPHHILNGPGTFSIYVEYAVLTTAGWATYGEFANHRISAGGFTDSGGATSCTI